jgi:hypothetical protein
MSYFFDRQGVPLTMERANDLLGDREYVRVASHAEAGCWVSTVWLGMNMNHLRIGPPLLFETMIFGPVMDRYQWRWPTEAAALAGHDQIVMHLRAEIHRMRSRPNPCPWAAGYHRKTRHRNRR